MVTGDEWTYNQSMVYPPHVAIYRDEHLWVSGNQDLLMNGTSYHAVVLELDQHMDMGSNRKVDTHVTEWRRSTDLALLKREVQKTTRYPPPLSTTYTHDVTYYDPPCVQYRWPLAEGLSWEVSCSGIQYRINSTGGEVFARYTWINETTSVGALQGITVPAGVFEAFPLQVDHRDTGTNSTYWFAGSACWWVKTGPYPGSSYDVRLLSYRCGAGG